MGDVADKSHQLAIVKRRRDGVEIHDVLAAAVWIVGDNDVAGLQVFRPVGFHQFAHGDFKAGEQARRVMRLCHCLAFGVGDDAGDVLDLSNDRGASGAHQRVAHLVGDLLQGVADDLHGDEIGHDAPRSLMNNPRSGATVAVLSMGISVTDVGSSTMAGPRSTMPGRRLLRSNTFASRNPILSK